MADRAKTRPKAGAKLPAVVEPSPVVAVVPRTSTGRVLRSLGQQLLCEQPETSAEIARRIGCSKQLIAQYRSGEKIPSVESQRKLEAAFPGVTARAWAIRPHEDVPAAPRAPREPLPGPYSAAVKGTVNELSELLEDARRIRQDPKTLPGEKLKAMQLSESLLARRAKLERDSVADDDALESRLIQMPRWKRFEEALMRVLEPHPEVMKAVADALEAL